MLVVAILCQRWSQPAVAGLKAARALDLVSLAEGNGLRPRLQPATHDHWVSQPFVFVGELLLRHWLQECRQILAAGSAIPDWLEKALQAEHLRAIISNHS